MSCIQEATSGCSNAPPESHGPKSLDWAKTKHSGQKDHSQRRIPITTEEWGACQGPQDLPTAGFQSQAHQKH